MNLFSDNKEEKNPKFLDQISIDNLSEDKNDDSKIKLSEEEKKLFDTTQHETEDLKVETSEEISSEVYTEISAEDKNNEEELLKILNLYENQKDYLKYNDVLFNLANLHKDHFRHDQAMKHYYEILNSEEQYIPESIKAEVLEGVTILYWEILEQKVMKQVKVE